jgi:exodeoxyribonuclease V alpha subunit
MFDDVYQEGSFNERIRDVGEDGVALDIYEDDEEIELRFVPIKEISYKHTNGFGVYICEIIDNDDKIDTFSATGTFVRPLDLGQSYKSRGIVSTYRGKKQFRIEEIKKIMPHNKRGIISFLKSLNGIGFVAELIYEEYGQESLNIIKNNPLQLLSLSPTLYEELVLDWKRQIEELRDDYDYMIRLMNLGLTSYQAKELYDIYNESIFLKLEENPYFLTKDIKGYSFLKCDEIAQKIGIHPENIQRLCEGIIYSFRELFVNGDTYFEYDYFLKFIQKQLSIRVGIMEMKRLKQTLKNNKCIYKYGAISFEVSEEKLLRAMSAYERAYSQKQKDDAKLIIYEIDIEKIKEALNILVLEERIVIEGNKVYKKDVYIQEVQIAVSIARIIEHAKPINDVDIEKILDDYLYENNISLEAKQREAVLGVATEHGGITIIDGSAGCGKTFCMKIALHIIEQLCMQKNAFFEKIIIAPTGKASKVAQKATGIPAFTVHRALAYNPNFGYQFNSTNRLPYDCIVIDESSMLDTELTYHLFSAIAPTTKVIIMGDSKQLPPIGAGNVLRDLIESNKIRNITLNVIKRQGLDSGIITNARHIINGEMITSQKERMDALVYRADTPDDVYSKIFKVMDALSKKYSLDEIQVLSPQKTGVCGTNYLNFLLQEKFNSNHNEIRFLNKQISLTINNRNAKFDLYFKRGDKVINMRNNYSIPWYKNENGRLVLDGEHAGITNGETGTIVKLIETKTKYNEYIRKIVVRYEDKYIIYENDFSDIEHAYALTIHKSQGSEWLAVILVLSHGNRMMLDRNLLYTGYTRAREFEAVITDVPTLETCLRTQKSLTRNTGLKERIREYII